MEETSHHRDEEQVQLDVNRAFIYYPSSKCPRLHLAISPDLQLLVLRPES